MQSLILVQLLEQIEIWVPHRISGFFQMMDPKIPKPNDLNQIGSRGGGPSLGAFGKTIVSKFDIAQEIPQDNKFQIVGKIRYKILINGNDVSKTAQTSISVLNLMEKLLPVCIIEIQHDFELPLGCGYGSSGAGALGLAIALNQLFDLGMDSLSIGEFAHQAEVINHTGLGTVGGQYSGGLTISMEPGYPFKMTQIYHDPDVQIVVASFGPISTKEILTDDNYRALIHRVGSICMQKLVSKFGLKEFMDVCKDFLENSELLDKLNLSTIKEIIKELYEIPIFGASMNQLGNSIFCICSKDVSQQVNETIEKYSPSHCLKTLEICNHGPIIKNHKKYY